MCLSPTSYRWNTLVISALIGTPGPFSWSHRHTARRQQFGMMCLQPNPPRCRQLTETCKFSRFHPTSCPATRLKAFRGRRCATRYPCSMARKTIYGVCESAQRNGSRGSAVGYQIFPAPISAFAFTWRYREPTTAGVERGSASDWTLWMSMGRAREALRWGSSGTVAPVQ